MFTNFVIKREMCRLLPKLLVHNIMHLKSVTRLIKNLSENLLCSLKPNLKEITIIKGLLEVQVKNNQ